MIFHKVEVTANGFIPILPAVLIVKEARVPGLGYVGRIRCHTISRRVKKRATSAPEPVVIPEGIP
jgi:hypothetical protein